MIADQLNAQEQQLNLLLSLLEQETNALVNDDTIALYAIASQKEQLLTAITEADQALASSNQKQQLIDDESFAKQVETIKQLLEQCQQKNAINGDIIQASNEKVHQLSTVINQLQNQNAATYDKLGKKHSAQRVGKGFKA